MHRRVLIVDDEQATCELIERTVSTAGMDALVLNNSSQAARALSAGKFDLVFLDFHMSAPDGVELARQGEADAIQPDDSGGIDKR